MLDQCASVPSSSSYKLCSRRPSKQLIAFFFFCSFLLKIRPKCSAYSTPSSFVVSSPCWWNDHRLLCRCLTFIIFLSLSFAVGKLDDLCTRQCDGCNIKGTVLPLRQPRRRKPCHCGRRGLSLADITQCLWRGGGGGGSNCNHCAIVVGGGSAWARKLLTFFFSFPRFLAPLGWRLKEAESVME